ncbi:MAG: hypothetical protein B6I24_03430 [Bacteroidetes bacterium 4572_128]|nr:MAG: hypothetical protein B6I24_03430 [Bacteroidetes bacterium 4572_128]
MKNYYYILGISKNANQKEIKNAYRKLARKYHPDKNPNDIFFQKRIQELNEAYNILSKKKLKENYDFELICSDFKEKKNNEIVKNYHKNIKRKFTILIISNILTFLFFTIFIVFFKNSKKKAVFQKEIFIENSKKKQIFQKKKYFIISYGVYQKKENVNKIINFLYKKNISAKYYFLPDFENTKKKLFRVYIGNFEEIENTKNYLKKIQYLNKNIFIKECNF